MKKIRLTSICSPKQWRTIPTKDLLDEGYPVYGANGVIGYCKEYNHTSDTIIIGCRGSCGNVNIARGKSYINGNAMCLDDLSSDVDILYLYYFLQNYDFRSVISGTTIPQVTKQGLEKIDVVVSSKENQREIVRQLQLLDSIIEERHKELRYFDALIKSRFIELFGRTPDEEKVSMAEICRIITDGTHQPPQFVDKGIPFLFVSNIVTNEICYETERFITEETYAELIKRTPIEIGDVLLSTVGSYGHPAVVKRDKRFCFQRHIAYLKPDSERVDSEYLRGAILSPDVQRQIDDRVKGIAQKTLNLSEIRKIKMPLPPINQQKQFASFVEQTEKSKFVIQQALDKAQLLFDSLMQKYFG